MIQDKRQAPRKSLSADGILSMDGVSYKINTVDISLGGVSIDTPKQLTVRKTCHVQFEVLLNGETHIVAATSHVIHCFYSGDGNYKAGLQFVILYADGAAVIAEYTKETDFQGSQGALSTDSLN